MKKEHILLIAEQLGLKVEQVENTIELFDEECTIPFIARYRKEKTGSLDEVQILEIQELRNQRIALESRRETILNSIEKQGKLTDELKKLILEANTLVELEDLYLPYKPKRRTKGQMAKEKGLEPLAESVFKQDPLDLTVEASKYLTDEVETVKDALQGARDIMAEWINEDQEVRLGIRDLFEKEARIKSKVLSIKEKEGIKYQDYYNFDELLKKCPSHRLLAIRRGENECVLRVCIEPNEEKAIALIDDQVLKNNNDCTEQVRIAIEDSYTRLLFNSIETEFRNSSKLDADIEAINVFSKNLRQLLLSAPLGQKRVLAIDPGYRTGCKVVCLDEQGNLLSDDVIYPHPPQQKLNAAEDLIVSLIRDYHIQAISIGNGTASRETENFVRNMNIKDVDIFVVSEDGASIYSASEAGREEFPTYDATVRGSVSIGRRLMDPLAELVKIDPKSIGVGQYQHDVDQSKLKESLDQVVESCVNLVGVDVNTASKYLLTYVSGVGETIAQNIIDFRKENGPFKSRKNLKKVKRLGPKAFEQCAGFLRISNSKNPLDNSSVHPERYQVVERMASDLGCEVVDLLKDLNLRRNVKLDSYISEDCGLPTLEDIMQELEKPGRDPRDQLEVFNFSEEVHSIEDLTKGMILPGIVKNITNFGAFIDIGIKESGLVHVSQISDEYVGNPSDVLDLHQNVKVSVMEIDTERKRIQLSMKGIIED